MRLILIRHGETDWNKQGRVQGLSDLELNETGRRQSESLAQALGDEKVEALYTSPLKRARDTAYAIGRLHPVEVVTIDGLRELDVGEVDGLTYEEMVCYYGDFFERWMKDCTSVCPPGGSSMPELQERAWAAIQDILRRHQQRGKSEGDGEEVVIAVAHFFPILSILCKALGLELSECRRMKLELASITTLDFNPERTVLVSLNDTCHLKEEGQ
ncbi:MAG TPA: histidine phosphatase family protein [Dehalococcoidia bacterium]|nr:histidine phosphatase family protein [Dehalococcoidia bacterium]